MKLMKTMARHRLHPYFYFTFHPSSYVNGLVSLRRI